VDFSWKSKNGINYLTTIRNQHIPVYCGSCWAMGSSSALSDRLNIMQGPGNFSQEMLAVQNIISCGNAITGCGTCEGGDDGPVYQFAQKYGIPGESCSNYMAVDTTCYEKQPVTTSNKPSCYTCSPGSAGCTRVTDFKKLWVSCMATARDTTR